MMTNEIVELAAVLASQWLVLTGASTFVTDHQP